MRGNSGVQRESLWMFGLKLLNNGRPEVVQLPKSIPQTLQLNGPAPQFHKEISPLSGQTGEYGYLGELFGTTSRHKPLPP